MNPLGTPAYLPGIDVSNFQGVIDWARVKAAGIGFVFIKATDGLKFSDPQLIDNVSGCEAEGIAFGLYHFFRPTADPAAQARFFLQAVTGIVDSKALTLPPALDLEIGPMVTTSQAAAWLEVVNEALGREPLVYTSPAFAQANLAFGPPIGVYPLWLAEYTTRLAPTLPAAWSDWDFWQHTPNGQVDGVPNAVDLNWFHGSAEDLKTWIK
jgi:lysozyme